MAKTSAVQRNEKRKRMAKKFLSKRTRLKAIATDDSRPLEERARFLVGPGGGADDDVHAPDLVDLVVVDLREHQMLLEAQGVVAATVEAGGPQASEIQIGRAHV